MSSLNSFLLGSILCLAAFNTAFSWLANIKIVPSSFDKITEDEFEQAGVSIVIYANHMLRSAYPAMLDVANNILKNGRSMESEEACMSINELLEFIPGTK